MRPRRLVPLVNTQDDDLLATVYDELRSLARRQMAGERPDHSLEPTALVHEAWIRLRDRLSTLRGDDQRFYLAAAEAMRRILIDHARAKGRRKRGGDLRKVPLDLGTVADTASYEQIISLDSVLDRLETQNARLGKLVRLRFFAGLSEPEAARVMGISERTARREWAFARAWLFRALNASPLKE